MSKKIKTGLKGFDYMHCDDFAKYLSDMAAKGWHFKKWGVGLKFEKGEPEQAVYAVEVFTKASENDVRPEPHTQEFAEYCEAAGWKFIDANQKFCVFKKTDAHALELFTPEERVMNAYKGTNSGSGVLLCVLYGINVLLQLMNIFSFFENNIFSATSLFSFSIWTVMFLGQLGTFLYAFWKKRSMLKDIRAGKSIHIGNQRNSRFHISIKSIYGILLLIFMFIYLYMMGETKLLILNAITLILTFTFAVVIAKVRPESYINVWAQVLFVIILLGTMVIGAVAMFHETEDEQREQNALPLQISDYREDAEEIEDVRVHQDRNIFGSHGKYYIFTETDAVYYDIYQSKQKWILDKIWNEELTGKKYNEGLTDCTADWEAQKAFRNKIGIYYVRYEDAILIFSENEDVHLTTEQIGIIRDKLGVR